MTENASQNVRVALDAVNARDPDVRAFVSVFADEALAEAERQDSFGTDALLAGIPIVVKDIYDVAGHPTGNGSDASPDLPATADAEAVRRARAAGAIVLGKTTTHEYAWGAASPPTRNPHDLTRIPGGSSGGTAAAIAAGMAVSGLGTDTGGSIRIPAALCGVVGIKPTFGLVSRRGISGLSWSLDHSGPLGRTVHDVAVLLEAIAGYDGADPYSVAADVGTLDAESSTGLQGRTIGVSESYFCDRLDADVATAFAAILRLLERSGARIVTVDLHDLYLCPDIVATLATVESVVWHSEQTDIEAARYGPDVAAALARGRLVSTVEYAAASRAQQSLTRSFIGYFDTIDLLISPTVPMTAPPFGLDHVRLGELEVGLLDGLNALTIPANVTGIPALTVPIGTDREGLPIGLQIMGAPFKDADVLGAGTAVEHILASTPFQPS